MNVIYDIATIRISETQTAQVIVPRWEIPVLQVIHGDNLQVTGQEIHKRAIPNPADEFKRLADRYGPKNEDVPAVAAIYGNFGPGTTALRNEIRDSLTEDNVTPSAYRTPAERKLDAEKANNDEGKSIVEEAQSRAEAAKAQLMADADTTLKPAEEVIDANLDADIAALI